LYPLQNIYTNVWIQPVDLLQGTKRPDIKIFYGTICGLNYIFTDIHTIPETLLGHITSKVKSSSISSFFQRLLFALGAKFGVNSHTLSGLAKNSH
jgi:hypothetical protein